HCTLFSPPPRPRSRTSVKPPFLSSPVFEGVYNNARMIHFLTAVVGSTCDVRVKNGNVYEGIFKTLGSRCELAVDAVHKRGEDERPALPRREEITDTMVFSSYDVVTMTCRDVDLNYATRDTFIDTSISSTRVNGEDKEKVLQRWEGGDGNGEAFDLENDAANGWDANEMFRYNKVNFGVESTYDSSLSMYTVHLERGSTEGFQQREARAALMASEIESSPQYRQRVSLENEEGKSEEDKCSAVVRGGCDSPSIVSREGKYIPLPQRAREIGASGGSMQGERERAERGPGGGSGGPQGHNRMSAGYRSAPPSSSSPKPHLPLATGGPQPPPPSSECSSPLSGRGYSPPLPGQPWHCQPLRPYLPWGPASANAAPSSASPPPPFQLAVSVGHWAMLKVYSDSDRTSGLTFNTKSVKQEMNLLNCCRHTAITICSIFVSHYYSWSRHIAESELFYPMLMISFSISTQSGPQTQSLYHSGALSAPTPSNIPPGQTSPQGSFPLQGYSLHGHQGIPHTYPGLGQITQAHVQGALQGPHHQGQHGHPQVVMLQAPPPQHGLGQVSQHPQHGLQQGAHQHFYIGHPQGMKVP
uniref:LsmAD domain-containing protein n=1 Tax=Oncorhynchus tshawytscha TaxID=74940 RepID=A0AAZ3QJ93_ONCTS